VQAWSSDKLQDDWESERVDDSVQNGSHAAHLRETGGIGSSVVASTIGCTRQRCRPEFSFTLGTGMHSNCLLTLVFISYGGSVLDGCCSDRCLLHVLWHSSRSCCCLRFAAPLHSSE
jgi:hypothetical protein